MRIMYDHNVFSLYRFGGIARYFYELSNKLATLDNHDVEVFSPFYATEYFSDSSLVSPRGIKISYDSATLRYSAWGINNLISYVSLRNIKDIDIFHETYYPAMSYKPRSAKTFTTVHDMIHELFPADSLTSKLIRKYKRNSILGSDHIICVSENTKNDLLNIYDVLEEKISVIYHGASLCKPTNPGTPLVSRPYILFVGQRSGYKNFNRLLSAYSNSRFLRSKFTLACFGGGNLTADEKYRISRQGLTNKEIVHIAGDDEILSNMYTHASALVYPSLYEGFGIPLIEAMRLDCPVICSNTSCFPEVLGNAAAFFDPSDQDSIQTTIESILTSPDKILSLKDLGATRSKKYSWHKCAEETLSIYEKLYRP